MSESGWQFYVDRGGTFTDVVARDPDGSVRVTKLLSEDPEQYPDAALEAIRRFQGGALDPNRIEVLRMGTTVATNALLERRGARIALLITAGLEDLLEIGTQERPDLFALRIEKPRPLAEVVVGVDEGCDASGRILRKLCAVTLRARLEELKAAGIEALAVAFKHAYQQPKHELLAGEVARSVGFRHVSLSHQAGGEIGLVSRGDTACADAYLTPALLAYLERVSGALGGAGGAGGPQLRFMKSSGGLAAASDFSGKDAILSGPAGGVVGAQQVANEAGLSKVIAFDMGGTSTDVSRIDAAFGPERVYERTIAGVRLQAPSLAVHTIAAGGGSRIGFDGRRLRVGPESAGADPGPMCYRRPGGVLAVTDANLVLGRVLPRHFPRCFGPGGDEPLNGAAARAGFEALLARVRAAQGEAAPQSVEALAAGCVRIATEAMAGAIREISVAKGHDLADYSLVSFGGAGAQHACAVAETLGIETVLVPERAGVLSAWGIGLAPLTHAGVQSFLRPLQGSREELEAGFLRLEKAGAKALVAQGIKPNGLHFVRSADLRYRGVDATITLPEPPPESTADWSEHFARAHRQLYGFDRPGHEVEVKTLRVEAIGARAQKKRARKQKPALPPRAPGAPLESATAWFSRLVAGQRVLAAEPTPVYGREALPAGTRLSGPALVIEDGSTVVVEPGWSLEVTREGHLLLAREVVAEEGGAEPDELILSGVAPEDQEAFGELCRCLLEGSDSLDEPTWETLLAQGEGMELPAAAAAAIARRAASELGVALPLIASAAAAGAGALAEVSPEDQEAFGELCRCLLEGADVLDDEGWEALIGQAEGMGIPLAAARVLARRAAGELGVTLPAAALDAGPAADPELLEAFDELCRCLLEGVEVLDADGVEGVVAQGEGMDLPRSVALERVARCASELGVSLPAGIGARDAEAPQELIADLEQADAVQLEIMANLFMSIAEQMGATLRRVSLSVNIKERLDFSCALFDAGGGLVANAPHIPVHLGAMAESVRALKTSRGSDLRAGDVLLSNDPFQGGSHLPDVTVVTPVFHGGRLVFFVANRGHHADVGGIVPGSMPPDSRTIEEEGVRLHDVLVVRGGRFLREELGELLRAGPHPVRGVEERLADFEAQVAANAQGVRLLGELVARYGLPAVEAYMRHVQRDAAAAMREAISALPDGVHACEDYLDGGARIAVKIVVKGDRARVDFSGTDRQLGGNLNAPRAVVLAAVLYVFRTLTARPIPLNSGCFEPLEVVIPKGSLLDPRPPAAVVGGNVETSQRIVDVLYGALGILGAAQGTMNNLTFGRADLGYYETICGGAGAGFGFGGASAVHTHMTNTRITDPEVLERRYPVFLRRFAVRRGSGGQGVWEGGAGVVREIEFREALSASILSERRSLGPPGAHGAGAGAPGRNSLIRGGRSRQLPAKVQLELSPGDRLRIETPGGGGYDPSPSQWASMSAGDARALFREGRALRPTAGIAQAHVQANLVVLPLAAADAFEEFCRLNPEPCPLLERLAPGCFESRYAPGSDLRRDLPRYRIHDAHGYREADSLAQGWREDSVAFLLGCSFSAEGALAAAGFKVRHVEQGLNVPMYRTTRRVRPAGPFQGQLVVSMRPFPRDQIQAVTALTTPLWHAHGGPVHVGDAEALGIEDLSRPDWGDAVEVRPGEQAVFWACGVTSQEALGGALRDGAFPEAWTHAPGHMFLADATWAGFPASPGAS